jgi:ferredoxin
MSSRDHRKRVRSHRREVGNETGFFRRYPRECIDCGVGEPECPVEAIKPDTEAVADKWLKLNADYAKTWPHITVKRAPPADSKEWEGKPDKLQYFSPNPGAGD